MKRMDGRSGTTVGSQRVIGVSCVVMDLEGLLPSCPDFTITTQQDEIHFRTLLDPRVISQWFCFCVSPKGEFLL